MSTILRSFIRNDLVSFLFFVLVLVGVLLYILFGIELDGEIVLLFFGLVEEYFPCFCLIIEKGSMTLMSPFFLFSF